MLCWEEELGNYLPKEDCKEISSAKANTLFNILAIENSYEEFSTQHNKKKKNSNSITPSRIAKFVHHLLPLYFQACGEEGTILHIRWACPKAHRLYSLVYKVLGWSWKFITV